MRIEQINTVLAVQERDGNVAWFDVCSSTSWWFLVIWRWRHRSRDQLGEHGSR